jgi:hypothetical protein
MISLHSFRSVVRETIHRSDKMSRRFRRFSFSQKMTTTTTTTTRSSSRKTLRAPKTRTLSIRSIVARRPRMTPRRRYG